MSAASRLETIWRQAQRAPTTAVAVVLVWVVAIALVAQGRSNSTAQAKRQAELYTRVLEDHANRTLGAVEIAIDAVASRVSLVLSEGKGKNLPLADALQNALTDVASGQPYLRSLSLVSEDGYVRASSAFNNAGARLQPGLYQARSDNDLRLWDGRDVADAQPVGTEVQPHHVLVASRRLLSSDGQSAGWLVAAVNPDYFTNQYELLLGDAAWSAAMVALPGQVLASTGNSPKASGTSVATLGLFTGPVADRERGTAVGEGLSGEVCVQGFRVMRSRPLVLMAEVPLQHALAEANRDARRVLAGAALATAVLLAVAWAARRERLLGEQERQERERAQRQLREQYEMTEQLVDAMPLPVFLTDLDANLLLANQAWVSWLRLDESSLDDTESQIQQEQLNDLLHRGNHEVAAAGTASWPMNLETAHGAVREAVLTKVALRSNASGQVIGIIGTMIDITEYKQSERATERARQAAEEAGKARTEFVANVTHELRTPLQSIIGFAELGETRSEGQDKLRAMFTRIEKAGQRMLRLVEDLLDVSRIGSTVGSIRPEPGPVAEPVREVVDELRNLAANRNVMLRWRSDDSLKGQQALVDVQRFQQVARNVIANAIRFAPEGTAIEIQCAAFGCHALTTVRDHGPGIPDAECEAIFQPFVQSSRTKDGSGGTGLGLTICRQIMLAHGGFIEAHNHEEGGAVFSFGLPLAEAAATEPATAQN